MRSQARAISSLSSPSESKSEQYNDSLELTELRDPISLEVLQHPTLGSDGYIYEFSTIRRLIDDKKPSPFTKLPLTIVPLDLSIERKFLNIIAEYKNVILDKAASLLQHLETQLRESNLFLQQSNTQLQESAEFISKQTHELSALKKRVKEQERQITNLTKGSSSSVDQRAEGYRVLGSRSVSGRSSPLYTYARLQQKSDEEKIAFINQSKSEAQLSDNAQQDLNRLFLNAVDRFDISAMNYYLSQGADIDAIDDFGVNATNKIFAMRKILPEKAKAAMHLICRYYPDESAEDEKKHAQTQLNCSFMRAIDRLDLPGCLAWLHKGANVNAYDEHGLTALMKLILKRRRSPELAKNIMQVLCDEFDANVNLKSTVIDHPTLHFAVLENDIWAVAFLLTRQADLTLTDRLGRTSEQIANGDTLKLIKIVNGSWASRTANHSAAFFSALAAPVEQSSASSARFPSPLCEVKLT